MNPFGRRTSSGEFEFPFHMELDNPTESAEVEACGAAKGVAEQAESWVDVLIRLKNGAEIPSRVRLVNGKFDAIYYPDGRITGDWGKRREVAQDYILSDWQRMNAPSKPGPIPVADPAPLSDIPPADRKTREPLLRTTTTTPATTKKLLLWPWLAMVGIVFAILLAGLVIWAFTRSAKTNDGSHRDVSSQGSKNFPSGKRNPSNGDNTASTSADDTIDTADPNAPPPVTVTHGDLKVTIACEPGNKEILCTGLIKNIGNEDGDFYFTGSDYPQHGWARDGKGNLARISLDNQHFQLADRIHWNNWHVWMPAGSVTRFWFSYESHDPDASKTTRIDLDMMWGGNDSLGFDIPAAPINRTTYHSLEE